MVLSKGNENFLKGYRYLPLQVGYKGGGQIFKGYERSCYHPIYSDTIYQILSDTTYGPIFYFKIKNSSWEKYHNSDRFVDIDGSEEGVFTLLYENQDFFLGYIADKKKKGNYMQPFLYDKMKDKTYLRGVYRIVHKKLERKCERKACKYKEFERFEGDLGKKNEMYTGLICFNLV